MKPSISKDKSRLDLALIQEFLSNRTYWAKGRTLEEVRTTIEHSVCFGLYDDGRQIGFARVVTDFVAFAYLMDVFVLETHRGRGLGRMLLDAVLADGELASIKRIMLATKDAHRFYLARGFVPLHHPGIFLEQVRQAIAPTASSSRSA